MVLGDVDCFRILASKPTKTFRKFQNGQQRVDRNYKNISARGPGVDKKDKKIIILPTISEGGQTPGWTKNHAGIVYKIKKSEY